MPIRPTWYLFPGIEALDSQLPDSVINFHPFVQICDTFYSQTGIHLLNNYRNERNNPKMSTVFATLTALQVSFVEFLLEIGIVPDGFIGYSIGEFACSYTDGCYDLKEALLLSYTIGKKIDESGSRRGLMANVEAEENDLTLINGVYIASFNDKGVTLSGNYHPMQRILEKLRMEKIKYKLVNSYNTALHCPVMDFLWDTALESLYQIIPSPKHRSSRWISTTIPSKEDALRLSCPRYFLHNLTNSVYLRQALQEVPKDALIIEMNQSQIINKSIFNANSMYKLVSGFDSQNNGISFQSLADLRSGTYEMR